MKIRLICLLLGLCLFLTGCGWLDGSYVSVTPHQGQTGGIRTENLTISNYEELLAALEEIVSKGTESAVINVVNFAEPDLETSMGSAARYIQKVYPVGSYAVDTVKYEVGSNTGKTAVALNITYRHSRTEIRKIQKAADIEAAKEVIGKALRGYETGLVLELENYKQTDFSQLVQDYAMENPQSVMEIPQVTSEIYGIGHSRVVELGFSYQTSRDALRTMQLQVQPVFDSAVLYVSGEGAESQKFLQLYAFLMERFDYTVETSITPAYSLLRHGVGDSRAFATVYGAMCRGAGLECVVVTGTKSGEPWTWNIICENGTYYHVDLLRSNTQGWFQKCADVEMAGYVWDYSAYPVCEQIFQPEEPAAETESVTEETEST